MELYDIKGCRLVHFPAIIDIVSESVERRHLDHPIPVENQGTIFSILAEYLPEYLNSTHFLVQQGLERQDLFPWEQLQISAVERMEHGTYTLDVMFRSQFSQLNPFFDEDGLPSRWGQRSGVILRGTYAAFDDPDLSLPALSGQLLDYYQRAMKLVLDALCTKKSTVEPADLHCSPHCGPTQYSHNGQVAVVVRNLAGDRRKNIDQEVFPFLDWLCRKRVGKDVRTAALLITAACMSYDLQRNVKAAQDQKVMKIGDIRPILSGL
ncbi:TPA: hypothetical protein HA241_06510, partial [Candidatus Woesearchaeota archaeon]|nr:hypothetical protein [Candidatus Woesearchaeota archaeon]